MKLDERKMKILKAIISTYLRDWRSGRKQERLPKILIYI